jgi:hypothetical protein
MRKAGLDFLMIAMDILSTNCSAHSLLGIWTAWAWFHTVHDYSEGIHPSLLRDSYLQISSQLAVVDSRVDYR